MTSMNESRPTYPIHVLLSGRQCLVVGGGPVAMRKSVGLLASGALVTVVAPRIMPELLSLGERHTIDFRQRPYQVTDLESMVLAFAATDDSELNAAVVADCRRKQVFCCAADCHWPDGDFITPATFQHRGMTVSISTGGRDCRESKRIREILEKQWEHLS